mgnify:CR=1 FL=1
MKTSSKIIENDIGEATKMKKVLALILVLTFVLSCSIQALALNAGISQEEAIQKIKDIFDTTTYDRFNVSYNENHDNKKIWELSWSKTQAPYGSLYASIDAKTGNILSISLYKGYDPNRKTSPIPKYSEEEARKIAESFAKKLQPEEFAKTKLLSRDMPVYPIDRDAYSDSYSFNFTRMENDIPVEGNGIKITVDAHTGEIENYTFTWSWEPLPSSKNIISIQDAEQIFKDETGLKLIYRRYYDYPTQKDDIKLVYTLERPGSVLIDAVTGKMLDNEYFDLYTRAAAETAQKADADFTPVENKQVEITKNCISKEAAINIVKKYISIPDGFKQRSAYLYEGYDNPEHKIWNIEWQKSSADGEDGFISARVNAITSELLSFDIYDYSKHSKEFKQNYDRSAALKKAEEFLKKHQPERFANVMLEEIKERIESPEKVQKHSFNYIRLVNGIPYTANGFNITVDAETGKITNYHMNWHEKNFPSADGVLEKADAEARFLSDIGLELVYASLYNSKEETYDYKLVYKVKPAKSYTFDAFDFQPLDYNGKPIKEETKTDFTDIKGHWAEKDIQLLVDLGIIKSEESLFRPDVAITEGEFIKLLMVAKGHRISDDRPIVPIIRAESHVKSDDDISKYIEEAIKLGWVKDNEVSAKSSLSREKAAAFVIRAMGYEKVASIPEIYKDTVKDSASVKLEYKGHTAIAMGLKILSATNGNFYPKNSVSRAQAATILVRMLKASS